MTLPASGPLSLNDIQTEFGGTNPIGMNEYYAGGGLVPAGTTGTFGAVPSSGALSVQNFYGTSQFIPIYIEEVFQTWLYTGNGSTQTITNGIDLAGEGGLVWIKARNQAYNHRLLDTIRGPRSALVSNNTSAATLSTPQIFSSYNSDGFSLNDNFSTNNNNDIFASWTFRKQPKFFDVVTYTGNDAVGRAIPHNLGVEPGMIIVKNTANVSNWAVWHRSFNGGNGYGYLNTGGAFDLNGQFVWGDNTNYTAPTSTQFTVSNGTLINASGSIYVAYLFAHNAGGFGLTGTDNVISCGSYTGTGDGFPNGPNITLGYEPQWVMIKKTSSAGTWIVFDNMRGMDYSGAKGLYPNTSSAEDGYSSVCIPSATGFQPNQNNSTVNSLGETYIYIAIRRGPMKVPTTGTSVFAPVAQSGGGTVTTNFPVDLALNALRSGDVTNTFAADRLRGGPQYLVTSNTAAEQSGGSYSFIKFDNNTGIFDGLWGAAPVAYWNFRRAPGFFDEVCYTGSSSGGAGGEQNVTHNLAVVPELIIAKARGATQLWYCYAAPVGPTKTLYLMNTNAASAASADFWDNTTPTSTYFRLGLYSANSLGVTYVAYLFASCPGVSKVGSFTGTGATQVINCGFTGGARFVLIKATSTTGDWYVWDSARGIVAGNDPYLRLNSTAAEVTNTDWVDTAATGFELSNSGGNLANSNGVSYIFLAIS